MIQSKFRFAALLCAMIVLAGCVHVHHRHPPGRGYGPPAHAPAHGHRMKHHDHELVFDASLGVYVVIGLSDHYFHDGWYYRPHEGHFVRGTCVSGPWVTIGELDVPDGIVRHCCGGGGGKSHGKHGR